MLWERGFAKCNCILQIWEVYPADDDECWMEWVVSGIELLNPKGASKNTHT